MMDQGIGNISNTPEGGCGALNGGFIVNRLGLIKNCESFLL
jgi:hypothetical protein